MAYGLTMGPDRLRPAATISLSGFLPIVEGFELDVGRARGLPVAIGHGTHDPIIDVRLARDARRTLESAGADVIYRESPMPHTIDPEFIAELGPWLEKVTSH